MIRKLLTADDLLAMPHEGNRLELCAGELKTMSPSGFMHGEVVVRFTFWITQHVMNNDLGVVLGAETGFTLFRNPDTVRAADAAFVRKDRVPAPEDRHKFGELAPDLVVEVVSPSDRRTEIEAKVDDWIRAGVQLVWVAYPGTKQVQEHRPGADVKPLAATDTLQGGDVLPGFSCEVSQLFPV